MIYKNDNYGYKSENHWHIPQARRENGLNCKLKWEVRQRQRIYATSNTFDEEKRNREFLITKAAISGGLWTVVLSRKVQNRWRNYESKPLDRRIGQNPRKQNA